MTDVHVETGSPDSTINFYTIDYPKVSRAESCRALSNRSADEAVQMGLAGFELTAQRCAELADVYARLSGIYEAIDGV